MNKIITIFLMMLCAMNIFAQDYIFFNDSPSNNFYDPSWGYFNEPSYVELINSNKFPVSTAHYISGINSLKLHWNSKSGGNWEIALAADGWIGHDISKQDSISFYVYSEAVVEQSSLPFIFLEDLNNVKTPKINLSDFISGIPSETWMKVYIPLSPFEMNRGSADLTKVKTIFFGQAAADEIEHTIYIDDVRMTQSVEADSLAPETPSGVTAKGYEKHIDVSWQFNTEDDISGYYVYRFNGEEFVRIADVQADTRFFIDWIDTTGIERTYKVSAYDNGLDESELSEEVSAVTSVMNDEQYLTMVQEAVFRYFWDYAHPVSGLARERLNSGNTVTIGGSGFGVMAILAGINNNFITREQGAERMLKILNFLTTKADRFHGAFSHWLHGETGKVIPFSFDDDGGDLVETSFMIQGLLAVRQFFNENSAEETEIRNLITQIWETVEWSWYTQFQNNPWLYWHWSPNYGWVKNHALRGYNEVMITYLLAIASPTYPVSPLLYYTGWAGTGGYENDKTFYGIPLFVGPDYGGPLFFAHYSYLGFDPRNKKERYANYFNQNRNHTLINRAYCIDNPKGFAGYDENTWGLTASDGPFGYSAHSPTNDNGTIAPTAAISSIPYTPDESIAAIKNFYRTYGKNLWSIYGFKDAFNLSQNWFADSYIAIDQGPIIVMIENYKTGMLWENFMANPEIQPMLDAIQFEEDLTSSDDPGAPLVFQLKNNFPNPFNPSTTIEYSIPESGLVELIVYDILGKEVSVLVNEEKPAGNHTVIFNSANLPGRQNLSSGIYFYTLSSGKYHSTKKLILLK